MDGNDLNPVINTKGPMMHGPDPRPMTEMPNMAPAMPQPMAPPVAPAEANAQPGVMAQPGAVAQPANIAQPGVVTATMPGVATTPMLSMAEALNTPVASDDTGKISAETKKTIQKIIILVVVAVCTGFAVLALAIVVLTNIPRIADLENQIDELVAQSETMQGQIATLSRRIGYDVDVTFFDGGTPGKSYTVTLQPETREAAVVTMPGCSLVNVSECPEGTTQSALLSMSEYDLAIMAYNSMDGSAMNYTKNMLAWTNAILAVIGGDEAVADTNSQDWEIISIYDANADGVVSSREYGTYLLSRMVK